MEKELFSSLIHKYIRLISLYLNKKSGDDFTIDEKEYSFFLKVSKKHSLTAFFYKSLLDTKVSVSKEQLKGLEEYYFANIRKDVMFEKERNELFSYLNNNQIDFLPLKGLILKHFYLDPYTREFADNDILFGSHDELIKKYFVNRGYEVEVYRKTNHDVYLKKPFYNFEMHRALFSEREDIPKFAKYFDNYLKEASIKEGYEHELNKEQFYIYFTAHTFKHFQHSGCGIRTLIDYYLYLKNNELDFNYINEELKKLDLLDFSNMFSALVNKLFNEEPLNNEEEETLLYIASSGTYGTLEHSVSVGVNKKGKFRYFMSRIFPPLSFYKTYYKWAYYSIILIPVAWLIRFFRVLFKNPKRATKELSLISKSKEKKK